MPSIAGQPGGALPFNGSLDLATINSEWGLGTDLKNYQGVKWYYDGNLTYGYFNNTVSPIKISDFYGKRSTDPAGGGVYFSNVGGVASFTVPLYRNTLTIEIWGAGGGGGGLNDGDGNKGGDSSIISIQLPYTGGDQAPPVFPVVNYVAGGGLGGKNGVEQIPSPPLPVDTGHGGGQQISSYWNQYGQYVTTTNGVLTNGVSQMASGFGDFGSSVGQSD